MNDYIFIQQVPEYYVGHEKHAVHITVHVKKSTLDKYHGAIESIFKSAVRDIEVIMDTKGASNGH